VLGSVEGGSDKRVRPCVKKAAKFAKHTNDSIWENFAQRRKMASIIVLFKTYTGEKVLKATGDRYRGPSYLRGRKIRNRKQRKNIGKYWFVNGTVKLWNQLPVEALGAFGCRSDIFIWRSESFVKGGDETSNSSWKLKICSEVKLSDMKRSVVQ
jgi:hypothetical protein